MARKLTPNDCYNLMNELVKQATGQQTVTAVDSSSFVSAGETVLATGMENVMNSLSIVIGRTLMAVRPYNAKLKLINALNTGMYSSRIRKISFYAKDAKPSGWLNTDLYTNLGMGKTAGQNVVSDSHTATKSMWEQEVPVTLEMNFAGSSTWQDVQTFYENQLKAAFRDTDNFGQFISGVLTEKGNDIESQKEAFNRLTLLNHIAGIYDMGEDMQGSCVNLTKEFNTRYGTTYTSEELRTVHLRDFLGFFVAYVKKVSGFMEERSKRYHWSPEKKVNDVNYSLLRHTPKDEQRLILYQPLFIEAESLVLPEIFNDELLRIENYEAVSYWQSNYKEDDRPKVNVTPSIPDKTNGLQKKGDAVSLDYVVGIMYDKDALMTDYQMDSAYTTPIEARKGYRNTWYTFVKNAINDFTENAVIFYMADDTEKKSANK